MVETILKVQGMMCGMCESHINEVVRKTAQVSKVSSSHTRGETVIVSEQALDIETLKQAIAAILCADTNFLWYAFNQNVRLTVVAGILIALVGCVELYS